MKQQHIRQAYKLLRFSLGVLPIIVGLDKLFFHVIADWESYMSDIFLSLVPFELGLFVKISAVFEILIGVFIFTRFVKIAAYFETFWLFSIALNLFLLGAYDLVLRDSILAMSALALAVLSESVDA